MYLKMNSNELHIEGIKISKDLKKCETRLIQILGRINDNKTYLNYGCMDIFTYAEKYFDIKYKKTYDFLALHRGSKNIPELAHEINKGEIGYTKLREVLPALEKKKQDNTSWGSEEIKTLLEITKNTSRRKLEMIVKDIAPLEEVNIPKSLPKYLGDGKIDFTIRLTKEKYILFEKAMEFLGVKSMEEFIEEASIKILDNKIKSGNKKAAIVVDRIKDKDIVYTKRFGSINVDKKELTDFPGEKPTRHIPAEAKDFVFKRDGGKCSFCGRVDKLVFHHITPLYENGTHEVSNLKLVCNLCHDHVHNSRIASLWRESAKNVS